MRRLVLAAFAAVAAELAGIGLMATAVWLVVRAAEQPPMAALAVAIVAVRTLAIARGGLRYAERLAGHDAVLRYLADLRGRIYDSLLRQPVRRHSGDLLTRLMSDVDAVQDAVLRCLVPVCVTALVGTMAVCATAFWSIPAALVLAIALALTGLVIPVAALRSARRRARDLAPLRAELAERSVGLVHGAVELTAFGALDGELARADSVVRAIATRERRADGGLVALAVLVQFGTALVLIGIGAAAPVVLGSIAVIEVALPLTGAARRWAEVRVSVRRVRELLDAPPPVATPPKHDLDLWPGKRVAVVGPSGAGKSTLLASLVGPGVRGALADAHVFHTTVRANVQFAEPGASQGELDLAAKTVDLDVDWDAVVGEHGTALSGGQRQRLVLARAVLAAPDVLLLDEPVEGLDPAHADDVLSRVLAAAPGTVVLVTHRLTPLAHERFDEIVVLEDDGITQRGTHEDLVAVPGYYRDRWDTERMAGYVPRYINSYR